MKFRYFTWPLAVVLIVIAAFCRAVGVGGKYFWAELKSLNMRYRLLYSIKAAEVCAEFYEGK